MSPARLLDALNVAFNRLGALNAYVPEHMRVAYALDREEIAAYINEPPLAAGKLSIPALPLAVRDGANFIDIVNTEQKLLVARMEMRLNDGIRGTVHYDEALKAAQFMVSASNRHDGLVAKLAAAEKPLLDAREQATVLAALRAWQEMGAVRAPIARIASCDDTIEALTNTEIDELCERLNTGG